MFFTYFHKIGLIRFELNALLILWFFFFSFFSYSCSPTLTRSESNIKLECITPTHSLLTSQVLRILGVCEERKKEVFHFSSVRLLRDRGRRMNYEPCDHEAERTISGSIILRFEIGVIGVVIFSSFFVIIMFTKIKRVHSKDETADCIGDTIPLYSKHITL